jgi:zinc/manganese transport system ATP-binding protein
MTATRATAVAPLVATDIQVRYGERTALDGVSLTALPGEVTALIGPNGSGKSTLLSALAGIVDHGGSVTGRTRTAFVVQRSAVPDSLPVTVLDTVRLGRASTLGPWRRLRAGDHAAVDRALEAVRMTSLADRPLSALSGGQHQRALIAQGLAVEAPLLLLDEPTAGLDAASHALILQAVDAEASRGAVVVHATHDDAVIAAAARVVDLGATRDRV